MQFLPTDDGSPIRVMYDEPLEGNKEELEPLFREASRDALKRLAEILDDADA